MVRRTVVLLLSSFDAIPQTARVGIFPLHLDPPTIYHQEIFRALVGDGMGSDWQSAHQSARDEAARHTTPRSNLTPGCSAALSREELVQNLREAVFSSEYAPFDHLIVLPNTRFPITIQQARHLAAMSTLSCKNLAGNKLDVEEVERDTQSALQHAMSIFPDNTTTNSSGIITSYNSHSNPLQDIPYLKNTRRRTRSVSQVLASSTLLTPAEISQWAPPDSPLLNPQSEGSQIDLDEEDHYFRPSLSPTPDFQSGFGDRPAVATSHSAVGSGGPPGGYVPEVAGTVRRRKARTADGAQIASPGIASASHHANIYRRVHMELYSLEHPDVHMPLVQRLVQRFPNAAIVHWLPNVFETHQWRGYTKLFEQVPFLLLRPRGFHFGASTTMAHFENADKGINGGSSSPASTSSPTQGDGSKEPLSSSDSTNPDESAKKKKTFSAIKGMSRAESIQAAKTFTEAMSVSKYLRPNTGNNIPTSSPSSSGALPYTSRLSHRAGGGSGGVNSRNASWAAAISAIADGDNFENLDELMKALSSSSAEQEGKKKSYRVPRPEKLEIIEVDRLSGVRVRQLLWDRGSSDVIQEQDGTVRGRNSGSKGRTVNPILGERAAGVGARSSPSSSTVVPDDGSSIIPQAVLRYMNSHGLYRDFRKGDQSNAGMDTMAMPHAGGTAGAGGSSSSATGGNSGGAGRSPSLAFHATVAFSSVIPRLELHYDPLNRMAQEQYEMLKPYEVRPGKEPDLIVPIGGDGFMMHCIRRQWERFIPFFGVNAGHVGFLLNDSGTLEELFTAPLRLHHMSMLYVQAETEVEEESELTTPHDPPVAPERAAAATSPTDEDAPPLSGGSLMARNVAKIQAEAAAAREQPLHPLPSQKPLGPKKRVVERREELAFNDAWVERSGGQSALIRLLINGSEKIRAVRGDGVLVSTAAGSTAYAQALGASPFPVDVPLLQLVGSNVVSPPRWRPVHLSEDDSVELQVIDSFKRPCRGFVDSVDIGNVTKFKIKTSRVASVQLAFCGSCDLQHKLYQLQFPKGF